MKTMRSFRILGLLLLLTAGFTSQQNVQAQPGVNISFQTFYNELSPYGRWTTSRQYGSVWTPYVNQDFQPYSTNGYWEVTEFGNTWVSDYDWGWAPFHYGRWSYDDYNGWFWIPGYEWGPAWVNWRSGGDYYGWAPLGPGMNINVSINIPSFWWVFVPQRYISDRYWHNYCAPRARVTQIYNRTTIINNYYSNNNRNYAYGPRRDEIERVTRRSVPVRQIDVSQRGRVITDRSNGRSTGTYSPDRRDPVYNSDRQSNRGSQPNDRGRIYNEDQNNNRSNNRGSVERGTENSRVTPAPDRGGSDYPQSNRNREYSPQPSPGGNTPDRRSSGSYENARPSAPAAEQRSERTNPVSSPDRGSRSSRSADYGNQGGGRQSSEAPAVRQSESRGSAPNQERSSQGNSGGGAPASGRGSRGPR